MNTAESYDMIVVGAGISGLSLAWQIAQKGKKVLVLETNEKIGGCLNTHYHDKNDFWVEKGAHTFYSTYTNLIDVIQQCGLEKDIIAREKVGMKVYTDKHEKIMSGVSKWELISSVPNMFFSKRDGKTVKEYFGKIVGRKNYEKVFSRMFSAVIVQNADDFSAEFFLKKRKTKSKGHPKSFILKRGMQSFMHALTESDQLEVLTAEKVENIQSDGDYKVTTSTGKIFTAKDIALAVTPSVAGSVLSDVQPELANLLKKYKSTEINSRTTVLPKDKVNFEPLSFVIPLQGSCLAMVTRDVMSHEENRGFSFHFQENHTSTEEQETFMADLLGVSKEDITETHTAKHQLPVLNLEHKERIEKIKKLADDTGIYLTGNYFNGLSLEDCVERSNQEFARYLKNHNA
jgi:protoporphyrinogen oxidase